MEKANKNIETLIDMIIALRKQQGVGYCCDPESQADGLCFHDCNGCKETFYQIMKNRMMETYSV